MDARIVAGYSKQGVERNFVIRVNRGLGPEYVSGFNRQHQIVGINPDERYAMRFLSESRARKFVRLYSDAGYGLLSQDAEIIELSSSAKTGS